MSADCTKALEILAAGMSEGACHQFSEIRRIAMCDGWRRFETHQAPTFSAAIQDSWREIDAKCAAHGGTKPEHGFLQAVERHEGMNAPLVGALENAQAQDTLAAVSAREGDLATGEDCRVCAAVLQTHCAMHGATNPEYCDLWERYWTDRGLTSDDVLYELTKIETPAQRQEVAEALAAKGALQTA